MIKMEKELNYLSEKIKKVESSILLHDSVLSAGFDVSEELSEELEALNEELDMLQVIFIAIDNIG